VLDDRKTTSLHRLAPLAPLHQPHNLLGVRAARRAFPEAAQVACFDTPSTVPTLGSTTPMPCRANSTSRAFAIMEPFVAVSALRTTP
jgi:acetate kinase